MAQPNRNDKHSRNKSASRAESMTTEHTRNARRHACGAPSPWVARFLSLLPPGGEVLDLACGAGRHAALLAAGGHPVLAVDRDIGQLGALAAAPYVRALAADLEGPAGWPLGGRRFPGVVVTNYLHRPLLPAIVASVAPGGLLLYETFARGNERFGRRHPQA